MSETTAFRTVSPAVDDIEGGVSDLVDRVRGATGRQPIDEHRWARIGEGTGQRLVIAHDVIAHVQTVVGFVLITPASGGWDLDLLVDPARREDETVAALVRRAASEVAAAGGGTTQLWIHEATDVDVAAGEAVGLRQRRDLHQLRVPLPLQESAEPIETRPFEVGRDETAWLKTNAAAFADHPDQGRWTMADLLEREAEPWFDPRDFLLHEMEVDGSVRLVGFNWTKFHPDGVGEIYVIGVHPDFGGRGLGRRLCVAGLEHLAQRATTGMLYVDADNEPAMRLYRGLGFTVDHTNTALIGDIA